MKTTLFKGVDYTVNKLIEDIDMGEIGLPDIQRPFVWTPAKVRDLFDSMYKGFPVGNLLFWANNYEEEARYIGPDGKRKTPRLLIVDGQQRLTSLYAVLKGQPVVRDDYSTQRMYVAFRPRDAKFDVMDVAIRRDPEYIADISQLWNGDVTTHRFVKDFVARLRQSREVSEEEEQLAEAIHRLHDLQSYPFTALELSATVDEEQVADVFVRINSKGVALNQADFILTLMSVFWDDGRVELERFSRDSRRPAESGASPFNHFIQPDPDQLLRVDVALGFRRARLEHVYSILRGKNLESGLFDDARRAQQFEILRQAQAEVVSVQNWHEFLKALIRAGFRSGSMISSQAGALYSYAMFLIGKRDFALDHARRREVIARWFFMTSLTARYSASPETAMEADLARLRPVRDADGFIATLDRVIADVLTDDFWTITLPNLLATSASRGPSLFAYYAALNLLDAQVLFSQLRVSELLDPALRPKRASLARHHLFPKNYLRRLGVTNTNETNQIANYALVEWPDNADISDSAPAWYFPRYAAALSARELTQMRYWHALPEGWEHMPYDRFLVERRQRMAQVIKDGFMALWRQRPPDRSAPDLSLAYLSSRDGSNAL